MCDFLSLGCCRAQLCAGAHRRRVFVVVVIPRGHASLAPVRSKFVGALKGEPPPRLEQHHEERLRLHCRARGAAPCTHSHCFVAAFRKTLKASGCAGFHVHARRRSLRRAGDIGHFQRVVRDPSQAALPVWLEAHPDGSHVALGAVGVCKEYRIHRDRQAELLVHAAGGEASSCGKARFDLRAVRRANHPVVDPARLRALDGGATLVLEGNRGQSLPRGLPDRTQLRGARGVDSTPIYEQRPHPLLVVGVARGHATPGSSLDKVAWHLLEGAGRVAAGRRELGAVFHAAWKCRQATRVVLALDRLCHKPGIHLVFHRLVFRLVLSCRGSGFEVLPGEQPIVETCGPTFGVLCYVVLVYGEIGTSHLGPTAVLAGIWLQHARESECLVE
mmetsp:Transcript_12706/g.15344  ORF Transcript_12706/g.15344 Transcript_12706/m.15344 type:complete len:388 (+) Transcript_12706:1354-2517(+)